MTLIIAMAVSTCKASSLHKSNGHPKNTKHSKESNCSTTLHISATCSKPKHGLQVIWGGSANSLWLVQSKTARSWMQLRCWWKCQLLSTSGSGLEQFSWRHSNRKLSKVLCNASWHHGLSPKQMNRNSQKAIFQLVFYDHIQLTWVRLVDTSRFLSWM